MVRTENRIGRNLEVGHHSKSREALLLRLSYQIEMGDPMATILGPGFLLCCLLCLFDGVHGQSNGTVTGGMEVELIADRLQVTHVVLKRRLVEVEENRGHSRYREPESSDRAPSAPRFPDRGCRRRRAWLG